jgi:hypothetical protein
MAASSGEGYCLDWKPIPHPAVYSPVKNPGLAERGTHAAVVVVGQGG